jgi:hypothetical protein
MPLSCACIHPGSFPIDRIRTIPLTSVQFAMKISATKEFSKGLSGIQLFLGR